MDVSWVFLGNLFSWRKQKLRKFYFFYKIFQKHFDTQQFKHLPWKFLAASNGEKRLSILVFLENLLLMSEAPLIMSVTQRIPLPPLLSAYEQKCRYFFPLRLNLHWNSGRQTIEIGFDFWGHFYNLFSFPVL